MKDRIKKEFGINAEKMDLIRDFFPMKDLTNYVAVCRAWASLVKKHPNENPFDYLAEAVDLGTNMKFKPTPIDFTESIKFVRHRLSEGNSQNLLN